MRARTLMYHDLSDSPSGFNDAWARQYKISENEFSLHLDALAAAGLSDRIASVERAAWEKIPVFLTFDDGGASFQRIAELLSLRNWCGHFFITTGRMGEADFLDTSDIRAIHSLGHVIGSHSVNHPTRMRALSRDELDREWKESIDTLEQTLGARVGTASVPGGFYSREVALSAARAGIRFLFNSEPVERVRDVEDCRLIGRYYIQRGASAQRAAAFASGDWRTCTGQRLQWNARKVLKAFFGPAYVAAGQMLKR
jgi:peptidoglycan/xylan/chitin deacetylase (PgdA/CDA1 family)